MAQFRLYTYNASGVEQQTTFSFVPLEGDPGRLIGPAYSRESQTTAWGKKKRRPFGRRERRELTVGAGTLVDPLQYAAFQTLLDAHRVEWQRQLDGKATWIEFVPDLPQEIEYDLAEGIPILRRFKITFEQAAPVMFTDFKNAKKQFTD